MDYYKELLGQNTPTRVKAREGFLKMGPVLIIENQVDLLRAYNAKEVKEAIYQIDSSKSPGRDGFGSGFF